MSDLNKKSFFQEVVHHLEEIESLYDESEFEHEEIDDSDEEAYKERDALERFINHIKDAKQIAEEEG